MTNSAESIKTVYSCCSVLGGINSQLVVIIYTYIETGITNQTIRDIATDQMTRKNKNKSHYRPM